MGSRGAKLRTTATYRLPVDVDVHVTYRIHVSDELFAMNDGSMLERAIKATRGKTLLMPERLVDRPDRDRLAARFALHQMAN